MKTAEQDCKTAILVRFEHHDSTHICSQLFKMNAFPACVPSAEDFLMLMTQTSTIPITIIFKSTCSDPERLNHIANRARQQFQDNPIVFLINGPAEVAGFRGADFTRYLEDLVSTGPSRNLPEQRSPASDNPMDVSQLDAGIVRPRMTNFSISRLLEQVTAPLGPVAAAKGIHLAIVPISATVRSDRDLLGRVLRTLIGNAVRHTERGRVLVDCLPRGDRLRIEVRDTGVGIPQGDIERIWDGFHQGGGPGLALTHQISRLLGHPVEAASVPGEGSTFAFEVPLEERPVTLVTAAAVTEAKAEAAPVVQHVDDGKVVIVIDDEAIILMGLESMLRACGYRVVTAAVSGEQALERLRASSLKPDVVIADYWLRGGPAGIEAILKISDLVGGPIPGIILTGETGPEPVRDAATHGFTLLHKPVAAQQLIIAIDRLIAGAGDPSAAEGAVGSAMQ